MCDGSGRRSEPAQYVSGITIGEIKELKDSLKVKDNWLNRLPYKGLLKL
ncbi:hypothetical protein [Sphingobacterium sp. JB170]|nr:hypothetical protein [Sphingobacterium sp. JB170]SJN18312.1 hypothetical protein FM107_01285 [Sphingobacterium sp. JB170]